MPLERKWLRGWSLVFLLLLLFTIGFMIFVLEIWMVTESMLVLQRVYGKKSESGTNMNS